MSSRGGEQRLAELLSKVRDEDEEKFELEEEHLPYLFRKLHTLAPQWQVFSLQLGVNEFDHIQSNGTSADDRLVLALQSWLKGNDVTWKKLIKAIFQPAGGGHQRLASEVAESFQDMCTFKPMEFASTTSTAEICSSYSGDENPVKDIQEMLASKVAARWYQMGVCLGARVADLESIRLSRLPAGDSERMMLDAWLKNGDLPQTWQVLVDSVGHVAGGNNRRLAGKLSKKVAAKVSGEGASNGLLACKRRAGSEEQSEERGVTENAKPATVRKTVATSANRIPRSSEPDLMKLMEFPKGDASIDLTTEIGMSYRKLATFLLKDEKGAIVDGLESKHHKDADEINSAIYRKWLAGTNQVDVTWDWLVRCLRKANLHALADLVKNGLTD